MKDGFPGNTEMHTLRQRLFSRRALLASGKALPGFWLLHGASRAAQQPDYRAAPVPFTKVEIHDEFWNPRIEANRSISIWHCLERLSDDGDFGLSKLIEAAAYMLAKRPDAKLESYVTRRIDRLLAALEPRLSDPDRAIRVSGHFLEAAAAWFDATGDPRLMDAAQRDVRVIETAYGPGKEVYISRHEGQKIGLIRLYRETGDSRYWKLAKFFLDQRGRDDYPRTGEYAADRTYAQDHKPVIRQREAVGHCVRAAFLYIALVDIAALTGSAKYEQALDSIWEDAVSRKTYITGGIGSIRFHEQFGAPYELPNLSAWNETCASYGNIVWNHRLFLLHRDAKYIDVMERILYNGFLAGVSLRGDRFFYQNPLKSFGDYERFEWINVPCCPPNVVRLIASLGNYIYATAPDAFYINLFISSTARAEIGGIRIRVTQRTRYPWNGAVGIAIDPEHSARFAIRIRIPGWARNQVMAGDLYRFAGEDSGEVALRVNGRPVAPKIEAGYAVVERKWNQGDTIELELPMPVRRVLARAEVREDDGRVALQRGPLVYCAEWPDNGGRALDVIVPDEAKLRSEFRRDLLGGVGVITGQVQALRRRSDTAAMDTVPHNLVAIPYYAWANRGMGEMQVWMPRHSAGAWTPPEPPEPIARVTSSGGVTKAWTGYNDQNDDIGALYDGVDPLNSADESARYFRMRPPTGQSGWVEYEFKQPATVSRVDVFWFDDRRFCRLPASWRILYRRGEQWIPAVNRDPYTVAKDRFNTVHFEPATTTALRLEVEPQTRLYKAGGIGPPDAMFLSQDVGWREFGILEWRVK